MSSRAVLGLSLLVTVLGTATLVIMHGHPRIFWDRAGLLIVAGGTFTFLLMNYPVEEILKNFRLALGRARQASRVDLMRAVQFFEFAVRASLMFGVISVFVGMMIMLTKLDDPKMIAPAMALSYLGILYGVVLGEVFFQSLRIQCLRKLDGVEESPQSLPAPPAGAGMVMSLVLMFIGTVPVLLFLYLVTCLLSP